MIPLVLASASPRRVELLTACGFAPIVRAPAVDESPLSGEGPEQLVLRLSEIKAASVLRDPGEVVLAADTIVCYQGQILGKPASAIRCGFVER